MPTRPLTLTEFLHARIAEDEAAARAAGGSAWAEGDQPTRSAVVADTAGDVVVYREGVASAHHATHIARWDPARVLAECELKRRILARLGERDSPILRLLALPYADHGDYVEDWRP